MRLLQLRRGQPTLDSAPFAVLAGAPCMATTLATTLRSRFWPSAPAATLLPSAANLRRFNEPTANCGLSPRKSVAPPQRRSNSARMPQGHRRARRQAWATLREVQAAGCAVATWGRLRLSAMVAFAAAPASLGAASVQLPRSANPPALTLSPGADVCAFAINNRPQLNSKFFHGLRPCPRVSCGASGGLRWPRVQCGSDNKSPPVWCTPVR